MTIAARFTREEYLALPESPPGVRFARYEAEVKVDRYLAAGAREVWLVRTDPPGATIVRAQDEGPATVGVAADGTLASPLLPGFSLALSDVAG